MPDFSVMEDNIKSALDSDSWLGNSANIATRRARPKAIPTDTSLIPFYGFTKSERPALFVAERIRDDATWSAQTYGEDSVTVPFVIAGVVVGDSEETIRETAREIREKIEDFLRAETRKATCFGQGNDLLETDSIKGAHPIESLGAGGWIGYPQVEFNINRARA